MKSLRSFFAPKAPAVIAPALSPDEVWALRRKNRAERRRQERAEARLSKVSRICWRCGFGALPGIAKSNLVRMKDNEGGEAWGHSSPVVCAGAVRALTSQTRDTVKESFADFLLVTKGTLRESLRKQWAQFKHFLTEDSGVNRGGTRASQKTREELSHG